MAKAPKKSSSKKSSSKSKSSKSAAKPSAPKKISYEDLVAARREIELTAARAWQADRAVKRAYADHSDFKVRDQNVAEAREQLAKARKEAAAAVENFMELQQKARKQ